MEVSRKLGTGFEYDVTESNDRDLGTLVILEDTSGDFHVQFDVLNKKIKTGKQLIFYTYDINKNKVKQMSQDEFISKFFGKYILDGKQFIENFKLALLQNPNRYSFDSYVNNKKTTLKSAYILDATKTTPIILAGVGVGIQQATLVLTAKYSKRIKVIGPVKDFCGDRVYCNSINKNVIYYRLNNNNDLALGAVFPHHIITVLQTIYYKKVIDETKLSEKLNLSMKELAFYMRLTDEQRTKLDKILEPYKQAIQQQYQIIKEDYNKQLAIIKKLIDKNGTVPSKFEYATQTEKALILELHKLIYKKYEYGPCDRYYAICNFVKNKALGASCKNMECPDKEAILELFEKPTKKAQNKKQSKPKTKEDYIKIINETIPKLVDPYLANLKFENYITAKYGKVDMKKINEIQLKAIKSDIKVELEKLVYNVTEAIYKKMALNFEKSEIKSKVIGYIKNSTQKESKR